MTRLQEKRLSFFHAKEKLLETWNVRGKPSAARREYIVDNLGIIYKDPGPQKAINSGMDWLCQAQDNNKFGDGGVADAYNLITGWGPSYPETTGYIIPTFIEYGRLKADRTFLERAKRMLDWLCSIQMSDGSFQGGVIGAEPRRPTVFNTGQIIMGLAAGVKEFGDLYRDNLVRAVDWLVNVQDADGAWRKHESPFVVPGPKTYHAHVAWGLLEAERVEPGRSYGQAALKHIRWVLTHQKPNGWFKNCDLNMLDRPLTHTLGYVLRGVIEAHLYSPDPEFLKAGCLTADALLAAMGKDGYIAGRFFENWQPADRWVCMTGTVQIAICWLLLFQITGDAVYREAAYLANRYIRRRMSINGPPYKRGGIKGAFPVNGHYGDYSYLNWACKFFVDSNLLEVRVRVNELQRAP